MTDNSEIIYSVSEYYCPEHEGILRWDDDFHNIKWPIAPQVVSKKDTSIHNWKDSNAIDIKIS